MIHSFWGRADRGRRSAYGAVAAPRSNDPHPDAVPGQRSRERRQIRSSPSVLAGGGPPAWPRRRHGAPVRPANPSGDPFEEGLQVVAVLGNRVPEHGGEPVQAGVEVLVTALDETVGVEQDDAAARQVDRSGAAVEGPDAEGRPDRAVPARGRAVGRDQQGRQVPGDEHVGASDAPSKPSRTSVTSGCSLDSASSRSSPAATADRSGSAATRARTAACSRAAVAAASTPRPMTSPMTATYRSVVRSMTSKKSPPTSSRAGRLVQRRDVPALEVGQPLRQQGVLQRLGRSLGLREEVGVVDGERGTAGEVLGEGEVLGREQPGARGQRHGPRDPAAGHERDDDGRPQGEPLSEVGELRVGRRPAG